MKTLAKTRIAATIAATLLAGDNVLVTFDAAASNNLFFPDHRPMQISAISITAPDGSAVQPQIAVSGQCRNTFDVKLEQTGAYRIAQANSGLNASWKEGAETKRWRGAMAEYVAQGVDKKPGVELTLSSRRVETFVSNGAPSEIKATGKGLEMVPVTHPNDLYSGEEFSFKLMDNGKPATNVEITIIAGGDRYREEAGEVVVKSGADGTVKLTLESAGMNWLEAESCGAASMEGKRVNSMSTYVAVLEVFPDSELL